MNFDKFFKLISYAVVLCGLFALAVSRGVGILVTTGFVAVVTLAWFIENTRWQLSERIGIVLIFLFIPLFYLDWRYQLSGFAARETLAAGSLARLILVLAGIKLLQKKSDRDWIFLYLISFFEILLAAALSISPLFILALALYLLSVACAIVTFEIRKASSKILEKKANQKNKIDYLNLDRKTIFRLPVTATGLLVIVTLFAVPLFFSLPRVGGAGFGKSLSGATTGFSDSIRLGEIARVQQNNEIVMRVRIDEADRDKVRNIKWRGVALDYFDNLGWRKTEINYNETFIKTERDLFVVGNTTNANNLVTQTIYLEPLDTPILFSLSRPVAFQGSFQLLTKDAEGAIAVRRNGGERFSYKAFSDVTQPGVEKLRNDGAVYTQQQQRRYLQLPRALDARIGNLAAEITQAANANNRFDKARAIESYLQNSFGYTLDLKASGAEPLADFLFNIKEGHCEYFATAMAVMLRTQGIATRVVNGFQTGDYNETADIYVVRQRQAHSWVEVYFPQENAWVTFDPTPAAGRFSEENATGVIGSFNKYLEALETFWIQYIVSYDNQEQKSLMRSVRNSIQDYQIEATTWANLLQMRLADWWRDVRGDGGLAKSLWAIGYAVLYLAGLALGILTIFWLYRRLKKLKMWETLRAFLRREKEGSIVEFYERMQKILARKGFERASHQTPLEFAFALNLPEAVHITEKYNRVRFGEKDLNREESQDIENWLENLEARNTVKSKG
jgi:transglutaminase-like putative cysteine protease